MMYSSPPGAESVTKAPAHMQLFAKGVALFEGRGLAVPQDRLTHAVDRVRTMSSCWYVDTIQVTTAHVLENVEGVELFELRYTTYFRINGSGWTLSAIAKEDELLCALGLEDVRDAALAREVTIVHNSRRYLKDLFENTDHSPYTPAKNSKLS